MQAGSQDSLGSELAAFVTQPRREDVPPNVRHEAVLLRRLAMTISRKNCVCWRRRVKAAVRRHRCLMRSGRSMPARMPAR